MHVRPNQTPALISGAIIGRMSFLPYCLYIFLWSTFVYNVLAQWMWAFTLDDDGAVKPSGWLNSMGAIDFAGGSVIHISSGFAGLSAAFVIGRRKDTEIHPHNVPMVLQGASLLWFGWFGFNAGSAGAANGVAALAALNTHIAASACILTWMLIETLHKKTQTPVGAATAMVVGLVCVTPGCGYITPMASFAFGIIPAIFCYFAIEFKRYLRADDALDAFACHGVGGMVGCFLTGLFATSEVNGVSGAFYGRPILLGYQVLSIVIAAAYSFAATAAILLFLKYTIGIRVSEDVEDSGLDAAGHGTVAYGPKRDSKVEKVTPNDTVQEIITALPEVNEPYTIS
jgi:Amt family ammonium transporter